MNFVRILFCVSVVCAVPSRTPWETSLLAKGTLPVKIKISILFYSIQLAVETYSR